MSESASKREMVPSERAASTEHKVQDDERHVDEYQWDYAAAAKQGLIQYGVLTYARRERELEVSEEELDVLRRSTRTAVMSDTSRYLTLVLSMLNSLSSTKPIGRKKRSSFNIASALMMSTSASSRLNRESAIRIERASSPSRARVVVVMVVMAWRRRQQATTTFPPPSMLMSSPTLALSVTPRSIVWKSIAYDIIIIRERRTTREEGEGEVCRNSLILKLLSLCVLCVWCGDCSGVVRLVDLVGYSCCIASSSSSDSSDSSSPCST